MTTNLRKQKTITAIFWSVIAVMLLAMGIYAIRDLPMRLAMKVSPSIHLAIEMSTDNSVYKTVFKNYGNETLDSNINRTIEDGNKITLTGDIFDNIYSNEPLYIRITNYTQPSDVNDTINYSNGPALSAYFTDDNGVTNYPSYGVQNIAPYINGNTPSAKTFIVIPQSVIVDSSYDFNLKLELSNYIQTEYTVTQNLATGITSLNNFATTKAIFGHDFEVNLIPNDDNNNVAITSITFGSTLLTESIDYTYNGDTNVLKIYKEVFEDNAGNPLATTNQLTINTALRPANVRVYFYDECQTASLIRFQSYEYSTGDSFEISTGNKFIATMIKTDAVANLWVSINGEYSENYNYNQATGLLTISQNALAGDIKINMYSYWTGNIASSFAGGNGTSENPYKICSPSQLAKLASDIQNNNSYVNNYFEMMNDVYLNKCKFCMNETTGFVEVTDGINVAYCGTGINSVVGNWYYNNNGVITQYLVQPTITNNMLEINNMTIYNWVPIGDSIDYVNTFSGNFNGRNNIINNTFTFDSVGASGIFGSLHPINNMEVKNIIAKNGLVIGKIFTGGIVGWIDSADSTSTISLYNCVNYNTQVSYLHGEGIYANMNERIGGILGQASGENILLFNNSNFGVIIGNNSQYLGGIVGDIHDGGTHNPKGPKVYNCINYGNVYGIGGNTCVGGITGAMAVFTRVVCYVKNCVNVGNVIHIGNVADATYFGSVVGNNSFSVDNYMENNYWLKDTLVNYSTTNTGYSDELTNVKNNNHFTKTGTTFTLNSAVYMGASTSGTSYTDLLTALNAWVVANQSGTTYKSWAVDPNGIINNGYPYLV